MQADLRDPRGGRRGRQGPWRQRGQEDDEDLHGWGGRQVCGKHLFKGVKAVLRGPVGNSMATGAAGA